VSVTAYYRKHRLPISVILTLISVGMICTSIPLFTDILTSTENPAPVFPTLIPDQAYVIKDNVNYKLYYAGNDFASINLAQSPDGINWTPYTGNPIITDAQYHSDIKFYDGGFTGANLGTDPSSLTMYYRMWYQGLNGNSIAGWRYAESPDGIVWYNRMDVTQHGTPVYSAATGVAYGIADAVYTPGGENGDVNKTFRIYANVQWEIPPYAGNELVVMAYSANGYDWTGYDPTAAGYATPVFEGTLNMSDFDGGHIGWFKVIKNSTIDWEAFYSGGTDTTYQNLNGIGYATSTDGINWTRRKTLFTTNDGVAWRSKSVWMPSVVKTGGNTYQIWFLGSDNPDIGSSDWIQWKVGAADLVKDITAPTVTFVEPAGASTNVSPGRSISTTFSEAMDPATITASTFTLKKGATPVAGVVNYSGLKAVFLPNAALDSNSVYTATITNGVTDTAGNPMTSDFTWNFTTGWNYDDWTDRGVNFTAPSGDAYYPSVIYNASGFGAGSPKYKMWYSDGAGAAYLVLSTDGVTWGAPVTMTGMPNAHHVQVLYDADCFGVLPCNGATAKYRIWFWDIGAPTIYSITSMATAESINGISWTSKTAVTQNPAAKLIQDPDLGIGWNRGTYGPVNLFYQSGAANTGTDPWNYAYVMYYDGTDGSHEDTGLAYSTDGIYWNAYTANPVLSGSGTGGIEAWDCGSATYGTVLKDSTGYHFFYSGRGMDDGSGGCTFPASFVGIGYASSTDGKTWSRDTRPIFQISDSIPYRSGRIYTPSVINDGSGILRMYFSVKDSIGGPKKIGYATMTPPAILRVVKNVVNDNGGTATASLFNLHVKQAGVDVTGSPAAASGSPGTAYALAAGTYAVSEDSNAAYAVTFSGDCDATGSITLNSGEDKTCTVTNNDIAAGGGAGAGSNGGGVGGNEGNGGGSGAGANASLSPSLHPTSESQAPIEPPCSRNSATVPFTDDLNQWSKTYIETLYKNCIINGRTDTLFQPGDNIRRAELVKIALKSFKIPTAPYEKLFRDVSENDWFAPYVTAGAITGIVEGYVTDPSKLPFFKPDRPVTRAEALKIILKAKGVTDFGNFRSRFYDVRKGDWFFPYVTYIENIGIIEGYTETFGKSGPVRDFYILPPFLGPGNSGKDVGVLKEIMMQLGYYKGPIDRIYDQQLTDAVTKFQIAKNIPPMGYMGINTRTALLDEIFTPFTISDFRPDSFISREEASKIVVLLAGL